MSNTVNSLAANARTDNTYMLPLWEAVERLIGTWAYRYIHNNETRLYDENDLLQAGYLALVDAVKGYDPQAGMKFTTYLNYHVRRHFAEVSGHRGTKQRPEVNAISLDIPLSDESDTTRANTIPDPSAAEAFENTIDNWQRQQLHAVMEECLSEIQPERERVIRARYHEGRTLRQIAEEKNCTPNAVRLLEGNALRELRRPNHARRLKPFYSALDLIQSRAHVGVGFGAFKRRGASTPEWIVELLEKYAAQEVTI